MTNQGEISIPKLLIGLAVVMLISVASTGAETPARLTEVTVGTRDEATSVTVKTGGVSKYHASLIDPYRLVVDFDDTRYEWRKTPLTAEAAPIKEIRGSQFRKGVARLVVQLSRPSTYAVEDTAEGIVILLGKTGARALVSTPPAPAAPQPVPPTPSAKVELAAPPVRIAQAPTPPPAPAPPAGTITSSNGRRLISLEFKDADVVNLLRILAAESGRNIVMGDDVKGKMSISLRNVPWSLALQSVLETRGLQRIDRDGVIRIVSTEQLLKEREARAKEEDAKTKAEEAKAKSQIEIRTKVAEAELKEQD